jgi:succinate dehydrogenase / fumarate reductase iron-sulfur subunit
MAGYDLTLRLWRGDATGGGFADYVVPVDEGEVVLDAIHRVQAMHAGDLAVRWNCKAGKCGSCSAEINGRPRLLCLSRLSAYDQGAPITVTPLRTFPVIKDLVTDVSYNYVKAREVPAFAPRPREADGTHRMAQVDVNRPQEFRKCIECYLCQTVCHVIRDHEENKPVFAGPRLFIRYAELEMHPLDTNDRRQLVSAQAGLGMCNITKCCSEVCPEGIKITDNAIIPLKERVVDVKYDPALWMGQQFQGERPARAHPRSRLAAYAATALGLLCIVAMLAHVWLPAAAIGIVTVAIGLWAQMISETTGQRSLAVAGVTAGGLAIGLGVAYSGVF